MNKTMQRNWLGSAYLSAALVFGIGVMGVRLVGAYAADAAPALANYNWSQHRQVVALLVPQGDCGCGMKPVEVARKAAEHGIDFVQISAQTPIQTAKSADAKNEAIRVIDPQTFASYCSGEHSVALQIRNGRIVSRASGNLLDNYFDRFAS